jgi:hypothetical protein
MALGVNIFSVFDPRGIEKAIKEFERLKTTSDKVQFAISKAALPAAAALAGLAAAAGFAVNAAIQDQAEQEKLAQTLRNVAGASDQAIKANEEYLASLQRTTTFSDSEMRPALAGLVQASGDLSKAQRDLRLAQDIAVATGTPLIAVTDALGKAYNDNFKSLRALSPALADNIKQGQSLDEIFKELESTFGGASAAAAGTAAGQLTILRNSIAETGEEIGAALLPAFASILGPIRAFAELAQRNVPLTVALGVAVGVFAAAIVSINLALKTYAILSALATAATVAFNGALSAGKIGLIIAGISALAGGVAFLASKIRGATEDTNRFYGALNNRDVFTAAGDRFINLTNSVLKLNGRLASTTNQVDTQNRRLEGLAAQYGVTSFSVGKFMRDQKGAKETVKTVAEQIKEYTSALKASESAARGFRDAQKGITQAQTELRTANDDLIKAQEEFRRITQGFGRDSAQAANKQEEIDRAQRDVERSAYDVEQAVFAVRDAEKKLAELRATPDADATEIRKGEIALAEAKLSVKDATDRQRQSTRSLASAEQQLDEIVNGAKEGSDAYKEALDAVNQAKARQVDATDRVVAAIERERDAIREVAEAEQELDDLRKKISKEAQRRAESAFGKPVTTTTTAAGGAVTGAMTGLAPAYAGAAAVGAIDPTSFFDVTGGAGVANEFNVTINAGMGADGATVAREFVDYLKQYERVNGYIPITVEGVVA